MLAAGTAGGEEAPLESDDGILLKVGKDVRVDVEGDRDAGVAQALAHDLRVHVVGQEQARVRVAKVMEADARDAGLGDERVEVAADQVQGGERRAAFAGEDKTMVAVRRSQERLLFVPSGLVHAERGDELRQQDVAASASLGLGLAEDRLRAGPVERLLDRSDASIEVQVAPSETQKLVLAHAGEGGCQAHLICRCKRTHQWNYTSRTERNPASPK